MLLVVVVVEQGTSGCGGDPGSHQQHPLPEMKMFRLPAAGETGEWDMQETRALSSPVDFCGLFLKK